MTSPTPYDTIATILDVHTMISGFIAAAIDDIPDARMAEQPGTLVNHPAWTLSHLNAYSALLLSMLDDPSVPTAETEMEQYGYGTIPVPTPAAYAGKRELLDRFNDRNAKLAKLVAAKHAEYFPRQTPEKFRRFSPTIGHIAITLLVAHPPHHLGQLYQWRRAAGIASHG